VTIGALDYVHLFEPKEKLAAQELFELNIRAEKRIYECYGLDADNNAVAYDNSVGRALYRATMRALAVGIEIGRRPLRHRPAVQRFPEYQQDVPRLVPRMRSRG